MNTASDQPCSADDAGSNLTGAQPAAGTPRHLAPPSPQEHVAGATIRHASPFAELRVPCCSEPLDPALRERWVVPLYFGLHSAKARAHLEQHLHAADEELAGHLLQQVDWRPRYVGAHLAALIPCPQLESLIGRLLLRSDLCYAGFAYCVALARFASADAADYLDRYLDHYLSQPHLYFDQQHAMAALAHLDRQRREHRLARHLPAWHAFVADKPTWQLDEACDHFEGYMALLATLERHR
ncbi:hypothetical protein SAMN05216588_10377 [Pseudomonas flavescens]|uniref:Uncharacterized protein n=1 Tax=Phytopseudomonas flavescens TaxID=29435 RepID=A0A1G8A9J4_9GAMM|nr:DUF6000 family protein [Pseudomonas flavescens]SDH17551.1 hypothetical protein SAMN05216588_10377 [Pseudomonas flavescens]